MGEKIISFIALGAVVVSIVLQIWFFQGKNLWCIYFACAVIIGSCIVRKETPEDLGIVDLRLFILVLGIFFGKSLWLRSPILQKTHSEALFFGVLWYFSWAVIQQFILNAFFVKHLQYSGIKTKLHWWAGMIFGIMHLPNPILAPVCFGGGAGASYLFLRMNPRNLYLIAIVHALIGTAINLYAPLWLHHHMAVGRKFLMWTATGHPS